MNIPFIFIISLVSSSVPIIIGLFYFRFIPSDLRIFLLYLVIGFLSSVVSIGLAMMKLHNLWLMHIYTPLQFAFLMWLFSSWQKARIKQILLLAIPAFFTIWLIGLVFFENMNEFSSYTRPLEALVLIAVSAYTLFHLQKEEIESIFRKPSLWIASGTLVYFTGMIFLYTLSNFLLKEEIEILRLVWAPIQTTVNVIANLLFVGGFLCLRPQ